MSCSCRTSTLGVFVRSLTGLRLSNTHPRAPISTLTSRTSARSSLRGLQSSISYTRPFGATASRPQNTKDADNTMDELFEQNSNTAMESEREDGVTMRDLTSLENDAITKSKAMGAILDLTPESIAALTEPLQFDDQDKRPNQRRERNRSSERTRSRYTGREDIYPRGKKYDSALYRRKIMPREPTNPTHDNEIRTPREHWQIQKEALKEKFPDGWAPRKRLSPDALEGIRALHSQYPDQYTTEVLARKFAMSAEAIRRILKSKWRPSVEEDIDRQQRWHGRGQRVWGQMAELGVKPPRRWRAEGIVRDPTWNKKRSGPRTEYPYMPRRPAEDEEDGDNYESPHEKLGDNLV